MPQLRNRMSDFATRAIEDVIREWRTHGINAARDFAAWVKESVPEVATYGKKRISPVFAAFDSAITASLVDRRVQKGSFTNFETEDREEKRKVLIQQHEELEKHRQRRNIRLHELTVAGDPAVHLRSCFSDELTSYELFSKRMRRQLDRSPYKHKTCKKQHFLSGDLLKAVMRRHHPECNYLNADTMFSYIDTALPIVEALVSGFLDSGTEPKYFRAVSTISRSAAARTTRKKCAQSQRRNTDELMKRFGFQAVTAWCSFPTYGHHGVIISKIFFYQPKKKIQQHLELTHSIADACRETIDVMSASPF